MGCCWNLLAGSPACLPQIYFNQLLSRYTRYKLMLAGFEKVHMPANGDAKSEISIPCEHEYAHGAHQLSIPAKLLTRGFCVCVRAQTLTCMAYCYPRERQMVLEAGEYSFYVCRDSGSEGCLLASQDKPLNATHTISVPATVVGL